MVESMFHELVVTHELQLFGRTGRSRHTRNVMSELAGYNVKRFTVPLPLRLYSRVPELHDVPQQYSA